MLNLSLKLDAVRRDTFDSPFRAVIISGRQISQEKEKAQ